MQIQETSNCHCPSGLQNLAYNEFNDGPCYCAVPFCSRSIAKSWERERDNCSNGDSLGCLGEGILSRIKHVTSLVVDMGFGLMVPAFCIGGTVAAAGAGCVGLCLRCSLPCYAKCASTDANSRHRKQMEDTNDCAIKTIKCTGIVTGAVLGACVLDAVKCPVNLLSPELANLLCYQQEMNLGINKTVVSNLCAEESCCTTFCNNCCDDD